MYAIVDVNYRSTANSLGTVVQIGPRRFTNETIDKIATQHAGGQDSGGYIPCVGVRLKRHHSDSRLQLGCEIHPCQIDDIWGMPRELGEIARRPSLELTALGLLPYGEE
jgi:hypothetical protein